MDYEKVVEKWRSKNIKDEADLSIALDDFRVMFAYHSNKIENDETTIHDTREIFNNGKVINYTGDLRTLFELNNQKKSFEYIKPHIIAKDSINVSFIKELHEIMMNGCYDEMRYSKGERPGSFKIHDYGVGDDVGVLPEDVEDEVVFLCNELDDNKNTDVLTCAAYFHLNFESIHPFADGNGRVGRTLLNYYLMINDYPPTIIYDEDKDMYYQALTIFDKTEKLDGFVSFIKEETCKTWTRKTPDLSKGIKSILI